MSQDEVCIDPGTLTRTLVGGFLVMSGMMLQRGGMQYGLQNSLDTSTAIRIGRILFVVGWIILAWAIASGRNPFPTFLGGKQYLAVVGSLGALVSIVIMEHLRTKTGDMNLPPWFGVLVIIFAVSWIALGYAAAWGKGIGALGLSLSAVAMTLIAVLIFLPWQRKNKVVDGPGMPLLTLGWVALAVANAM